MKKPGFTLLIVVGFVVVWHIILYLPMDRERCLDQTPSKTCKLSVIIDVNPLTDVATLKFPGAADFGITDPTVAAGFNWGRDLTGVPTAESQLNLYARQYFDLYAMLLPYRVSIVDKDVLRDASAPITNGRPEVYLWITQSNSTPSDTAGHVMYLSNAYAKDAPTVRLALMCADARPTCAPLRPNTWYPAQRVSPDDPDYAYEYLTGFTCYRLFGQNKTVIYALGVAQK